MYKQIYYFVNCKKYDVNYLYEHLICLGFTPAYDNRSEIFIKYDF